MKHSPAKRLFVLAVALLLASAANAARKKHTPSDDGILAPDEIPTLTEAPHEAPKSAVKPEDQNWEDEELPVLSHEPSGCNNIPLGPYQFKRFNQGKATDSLPLDLNFHVCIDRPDGYAQYFSARLQGTLRDFRKTVNAVMSTDCTVD
jgi:hypothetical protein